MFVVGHEFTTACDNIRKAPGFNAKRGVRLRGASARQGGVEDFGFEIATGSGNSAAMNEIRINGKLVDAETLLNELFSDGCRPSLRWLPPSRGRYVGQGGKRRRGPLRGVGYLRAARICMGILGEMGCISTSPRPSRQSGEGGEMR